MFKSTADRFKNYITNFQNTRSISHNINQKRKIQVFYKKLVINTVYLKRQNILLYKNIKRFSFKTFFSHNVFIIPTHYRKNGSCFFTWNAVNTFFLTKVSRDKYSEFFDLFFCIFPKINLTNFNYYWLSALLHPSIKTRFYYFTNRIKFFSNQRLVKQHILVMYNTTSKENTYTNNLKFFRGLVQKKQLNTLFFFKASLFQLHLKFKKKSYFFRHQNFLKKFVAETYLKIIAYIAQW